MLNNYNPFTLQLKSVLVTGASSGIGRAIAIECSRMGAAVIITGRDPKRLQQTFDQLAGEGHTQIIADLSQDTDLQNLITLSSNLDGVVHCAGIASPVPFAFIDQEKLQTIFSVNFMSPTLMTRKLIKKNKINKYASIVFISSINGVYCSFPASTIYSASKGAINGLAKGMAIDLAPKNIRVNSVCPGMITTHILDDGRITPEQIIEDKKKYPLKRYGEPEEVAFAVVYLLSDATKWMTGSNILLDGGYTLL